MAKPSPAQPSQGIRRLSRCAMIPAPSPAAPPMITLTNDPIVIAAAGLDGTKVDAARPIYTPGATPATRPTAIGPSLGTRASLAATRPRIMDAARPARPLAATDRSGKGLYGES